MIRIVNPTDRSWTRHRYVLWFGAYAATRCLVWANGIEGALEEAAEWLAEHAPGVFAEPEECETCHGADDTCPDCDGQGYDTTDLTYTESGYIPSWEWGCLAEDPDRAALLEIMGRPTKCAHDHKDCRTSPALALACRDREERRARKEARR